MSKKRMIRWVVGIPLLVVALITVIVLHEPEKEGMNRAMAAKSVALLFQSPEELDTWKKEQKSSCFQADEQQEWYVLYMDYLYAKGFLDEEETPASSDSAKILISGMASTSSLRIVVCREWGT